MGGSLYITTTHLILVSPEEKEELWILHMHISTVEKLPLTTSGSSIRIQCSNFRTATFMVTRDRDAQDIFTSLIHLSRPVAVSDLYCFQYRSKSDLPQHTGWTFFDLGAEFLPDYSGLPGPHRKRLARVWTQVHRQVRFSGRGQQGDLSDLHPVHRHHLAAHEPVPSSIPIQPQVPVDHPRSCVQLSIWDFYRQLSERAGRAWTLNAHSFPVGIPHKLC